MTIASKTKAQLTSEIKALRVRLSELEKALGESGAEQVETENHLRLLDGILAEMPVALYRVDEHGVFTECSGSGLRRIGLADRQLVGTNVFQSYPQVQVPIRRALDGETVNYIAHGIHEDQPWWYLAYATFDSVQGKGALGFAIDITPQKELEQALRKAQADLEQRVEQRTAELSAANRRLQEEIAERKRAEDALRSDQELLQGLFRAQENDRKLLAYEIHDGIVQYATAASMHLEAYKHKLGAPHIPDELARIGELLGRTIGEGRVLMTGLRPSLLDERGVVAAISQWIEKQDTGVLQIEFHPDTRFERLAPALESGIFRIVQEAVTNACKHSQSKKVEIELDHDASHIHIQVRDWGVGFDPDNLPDGQHGLRGIKERVKLLQGDLTIISAAGQGTRIVVDLPFLMRGTTRRSAPA